MSGGGALDPEDLPDGVVVAGADGTVTAANTAAARMLGVPVETLAGRTLLEVLNLDDLEGHGWFDCVQPYDGFALRTRIAERAWYRPDGREVLVTARLVRPHPAGPVIRVVVCLRDAQVRARNDRTRSELVATVAHELRSPLTGVKGFAATLLTKWERFTDSQRLLMLETIDADADRLGRLVTDLLDTARIDTGRMRLRRERLDVAAAARAVLTTRSGGGGVVLVEDGPVPPVWADPDRLGQVLSNLVENALRHGAGRVTVTVSAQLRDGVNGVELRVDDQGGGIPVAARTRVFTRYWHSGARAGSGLGLYIVRGIVDAHDGAVTITDAAGGGASVRVWMPVGEPLPA